MTMAGPSTAPAAQIRFTLDEVERWMAAGLPQPPDSAPETDTEA
jgi:hypothetical protein